MGDMEKQISFQSPEDGRDGHETPPVFPFEGNKTLGINTPLVHCSVCACHNLSLGVLSKPACGLYVLVPFCEERDPRNKFGLQRACVVCFMYAQHDS